jgi:hypothetical protein
MARPGPANGAVPRSPRKRAGRVGHVTMGRYCQVMSKTVAGAPSHCLAVMDTL